MPRSAIDYDGALPAFEVETGTRFSLGLQETQATWAFSQNDMTGVPRALVVAAVLMPIAAWAPIPTTEAAVATPYLGFAESPAQQIKPSLAVQRQDVSASPQPLTATPPLGFSEAFIPGFKPFAAAQQQAVSFAPQGPIYSTTPQGWISESPILLVKKFGGHLQQFAAAEPPEPMVPSPLLGFAASPALQAAPFASSQQQVVAFTPQGAIYSITPQGWISESPIVLAKHFGAHQQQTVAFAPQGPIYSITPQGQFSPSPQIVIGSIIDSDQSGFSFTLPPPFGWASESPQLTRRLPGAAQQGYAALGSLTPLAAVFGPFTVQPDLTIRRILADEVPFSGFEPEPPFTNPLGFTSDIVLPRKRPFLALSAVSFAPYDRVEIQVSFTPSPHMFARPTLADEVQDTGIETPSAATPLGYTTEPFLHGLKPYPEFQSTSFAPFNAVRVFTEFSATQSPSIFARRFPVSQQQFAGFVGFIAARLFTGPPLIGKVTAPMMKGADAEADLSGKRTAPGLKGTDNEADLSGVKANAGLKGSVDV